MMKEVKGAKTDEGLGQDLVGGDPEVETENTGPDLVTETENINHAGKVIAERRKIDYYFSIFFQC